MIEGLCFDVSAAEMREHLAAKVDHHKERAAFYADKADSLARGGAEAAQFSGGDPVRALQDNEKKHKNRAEFFDFLRAHVIAGETYRLSESDLVTLEFISNIRW